jgi:hypothetical protein
MVCHIVLDVNVLFFSLSGVCWLLMEKNSGNHRKMASFERDKTSTKYNLFYCSQFLKIMHPKTGDVRL